MKKVIVIGSGIAGLAVSIRLASQGYSVKVFEKNDYPGGKLFSFTVDGYRFDGGPPLLTMPEFIRELYSIKGGKGACMIVEAESEEEINTKLQDLPFVKNNFLDIDIMEVKPYRGFV